jgi:hypothetical protein
MSPRAGRLARVLGALLVAAPAAVGAAPRFGAFGSFSRRIRQPTGPLSPVRRPGVEPERRPPARPLLGAGGPGRKRTNFGYYGEDFKRHYDPETGAFRYRPLRPRVLPLDNGDGPLRGVRLNFASHGDARHTFPLVLSDWLQVMRRVGSVRLKILVNETDRAELDTLLADVLPALRARIDPVAIPGDNIVRPWPRDPSLLLLGGRRLLLPRMRMMGHDEEEDDPKLRADYFAVVEKYARAAGLRVERSPFRFEGGNILAGRRHIFVGASIVENAMSDFNITEEDATLALSREFGKPVLSIGTIGHIPGAAEQPRQHIDLAMAIVRDRRSGREVVVLESTRLARRLLGPSWRPASEFFDHAAQDRDEAQLDAAERFLRRQGYAVIRVPGLQPDWGKAINYTNVMLASGHAMVPHLGVAELDRYAADVYRQLGYTVIPMRSAQLTLEHNGGPRCGAEGCR